MQMQHTDPRCNKQMFTMAVAVISNFLGTQPADDLRPVFGRLPEPNRAWLLIVYFSC